MTKPPTATHGSYWQYHTPRLLTTGFGLGSSGPSLINGLGLGAAPQGLEAPSSSGYGLAYGFLPFGMGNVDNLDGTPLPGPPPRPSGGGLPN
ncbi:hypothetical protein C0995_005404 [Termitomyces sp. Mi166|nr:hypothetical protein C0995_005404 [Termitomyces sp. Mi166\